jgi:hypothetical protein
MNKLVWWLANKNWNLLKMRRKKKWKNY